MRFLRAVFFAALPLVTLGIASDFLTAASAKTYTAAYHQGLHHGKGLKRTAHSTKFIHQPSRMGAHRTATVPGAADISALVSPPEDQGSCGSCWDFSLTKALRSAYMVAGRDPGRLEFNYLLNNCGSGTKEYGCNGGDFDAADNFSSPGGPGLDAQDPYRGQAGGRCPGLPVAATSISHTMLGGGDGPTFQDLAYAVGVQKQMVVIDVAVVGDWEGYTGGIYNGCTGTAADINHMIDLVKYSCESSVDASGNCVFDSQGKPANGDGWIGVQNNWGTSWGEGGIMRTRMYGNDGKKCNAVATDALVFQISEQPPSPPVPAPGPPTPIPKRCAGWLCSVWCGFSWCR